MPSWMNLDGSSGDRYWLSWIEAFVMRGLVFILAGVTLIFACSSSKAFDPADREVFRATGNCGSMVRIDAAGCDLTRVDMPGANLSGVELPRARLTGANLSKANLSEAQLPEADLERTDLSGAANCREPILRARS
jgi:uncharacterized protein YjbI with pentapeptide repeats